MEIILRDYNNTKIPVTIPDDTEYIEGVVISGDMVMDYPFDFDTSDSRTMSFFDGTFHFDREDFDLLERDDFNIYDYLQ